MEKKECTEEKHIEIWEYRRYDYCPYCGKYINKTFDSEYIERKNKQKTSMFSSTN